MHQNLNKELNFGGAPNLLGKIGFTTFVHQIYRRSFKLQCKKTSQLLSFFLGILGRYLFFHCLPFSSQGQCKVEWTKINVNTMAYFAM
jgi:hypothetical protein